MNHTLPKLAIEPHDLEDLAIFPLPDGILFPHTTIRLHVFEPRYRALVEHCLDHEAPMLVPMIVANGRSDAQGRPHLHKVAGAGKIIAHQELAGGRFNILVRGVGRARIVEELDVATPYRRVRAELLEDRVGDGRQADILLKTIQNCLFNVQTDNSEVVDFLVEAFTEVDTPGAVADVLAAVVFGDSLNRQRALSEPDVVARLEGILDRLVELIARSVDEQGPSEQTVN
jgi:hypothetical protein